MLFRLKFTFDLEGDTQFVLEKGFNSEKGEAITVKGNKVELEFSCNNLPTSVKIDFESDSNPNGKKDVSPKEEETTQKPTTKGEAQQIAQPVEKKVIVEDEVTFNFFYPQYLKSKSYDEFIKNIKFFRRRPSKNLCKIPFEILYISC